jgi:hypothetical protein
MHFLSPFIYENKYNSALLLKSQDFFQQYFILVINRARGYLYITGIIITFLGKSMTRLSKCPATIVALLMFLLTASMLLMFHKPYFEFSSSIFSGEIFVRKFNYIYSGCGYSFNVGVNKMFIGSFIGAIIVIPFSLLLFLLSKPMSRKMRNICFVFYWILLSFPLLPGILASIGIFRLLLEMGFTQNRLIGAIVGVIWNSLIAFSFVLAQELAKKDSLAPSPEIISASHYPPLWINILSFSIIFPFVTETDISLRQKNPFTNSNFRYFLYALFTLWFLYITRCIIVNILWRKCRCEIIETACSENNILSARLKIYSPLNKSWTPGKISIVACNAISFGLLPRKASIQRLDTPNTYLIEYKLPEKWLKREGCIIYLRVSTLPGINFFAGKFLIFKQKHNLPPDYNFPS